MNQRETQMQRDIGLLISIIDTLAEATGESPDDEDAPILRAIRKDWHTRETLKQV